MGGGRAPNLGMSRSASYPPDTVHMHSQHTCSSHAGILVMHNFYCNFDRCKGEEIFTGFIFEKSQMGSS